jgi:hypothetical protein
LRGEREDSTVVSDEALDTPGMNGS